MQLCDHGVLLYSLQWGSKSKTIFGFHSSICTQNVSLLDDNLNKSGLKESYGWFYLNVNGKLEDSSFGRYLGEIASATYFFRFWVFLVKLMLCMPPIHRAPLCFPLISYDTCTIGVPISLSGHQFTASCTNKGSDSYFRQSFHPLQSVKMNLNFPHWFGCWRI